MSSWLRHEAERAQQRRDNWRREECLDFEQFGLLVLAEVERQVTLEQKHVDGLSDPAWNAYESALDIIRSLREESRNRHE